MENCEDQYTLTTSYRKQFLNSANFRLLVFSYLLGAEVYHKIAVLDQRTRQSQPESGLLDQKKKLTMKSKPCNTSLDYSFGLADVIELIVMPFSIEQINEMASLICFRNRQCLDKQTEVDLTLVGLSAVEASQLFDMQIDKELKVRNFSRRYSHSVDLVKRLNPVQIKVYDTHYINSANRDVIEQLKTHYENVRSGFEANALPHKFRYPNCVQLIMTQSPQLLDATVFSSMNNLQSLEITQELEKYPLPSQLGQIPSVDLIKIHIITDTATVKTVEDLIEQVKQFKAESTIVTVRVKKIKGVQALQFSIRNDLQRQFSSEIMMAGKQVQIMFKHLNSKKQINLFVEEL